MTTSPSVTGRLPFALVDVFADEPLTGNPLAVVGGAAETLSERTLRDIAREFNQSETTFLLTPTRAGATWRLRSFTAAGHEVFGAGHNALGAWWWLAAAGKLPLVVGDAQFVQEIGQRLLPVLVTADANGPSAVTMRQTAPEFGAVANDLPGLADALGIDASDLSASPVPPQVVSTGAAHLLVHVRASAVLDQIRPDAPALARQLQSLGGQGCYVFALPPEPSSIAAYARFFNPTVGIWEDPATGSAAGPLAAHLVARGIVPEGSVVTIEQGRAMGRPSQIEVQVRGADVRIRGRAVIVSEGVLRL